MCACRRLLQHVGASRLGLDHGRLADDGRLGRRRLRRRRLVDDRLSDDGRADVSQSVANGGGKAGGWGVMGRGCGDMRLRVR